MNKKIKVAQIGISRYGHGAFIFESLKRQNEVFDIAGYALPENERRKFSEKINIFDGYIELSVNEILNDSEIDAVFIETEEIYLTKYALMAARKGKHIHMEKPGGLKLKEFEELISTVKANNTLLHLGYMYRYNPIIKDLLKDIKEGLYGNIISVEAQMNCPQSKEMRKWLEVFPNGMMFFLGCHLVDLILQIQGLPNRIIPMNTSTDKDGIKTKDFGMVAFEYNNGISFAKTVACEKGGFMRRQLVVTGTKRTAEVKPLEIIAGDEQYTDITIYEDNTWYGEGIKTRSIGYSRYDDMLLSFARMVNGEINNPYSYDYEFALYKTILQTM